MKASELLAAVVPKTTDEVTIRDLKVTVRGMSGYAASFWAKSLKDMGVDKGVDEDSSEEEQTRLIADIVAIPIKDNVFVFLMQHCFVDPVLTRRDAEMLFLSLDLDEVLEVFGSIMECTSDFIETDEGEKEDLGKS